MAESRSIGGNAMTPSRHAFLHLAAAGAAITANATAAFAQDYPARPARIVSGFPPGGV
ncbi:MAG TPA: hypothetical protein VEK31_02345 [Xanthobacteraceae bacterium]|nr:hypothetical protein [Xanthobacteraceae bacterium]